jgi:hypothetical protein
METEEHRSLAASCFNRCWELLEEDGRDASADLDLLTTAFVSRYHWSFAGGPEQWAMADWMVSRAAAAIGEGALALTFAEHAYFAVQEFEAPDWLVASCAEGMARAYDALGQEAERGEWYRTAEGLIAGIAEEEERALIADQLASLAN